MAARALACDRFRDLLGVLKTRFEFVIVDSAPVLPLVDSLLLGQHCDGAAWVIEFDRVVHEVDQNLIEPPPVGVDVEIFQRLP